MTRCFYDRVTTTIRAKQGLPGEAPLSPAAPSTKITFIASMTGLLECSIQGFDLHTREAKWMGEAFAATEPQCSDGHTMRRLYRSRLAAFRITDRSPFLRGRPRIAQLPRP
jgi:hypothetical protein